MNRDHLRLVTGNGAPPLPPRLAPCDVSEIDTFEFAKVGGDMVIMHNDKRCAAPEALVLITRLLVPQLVLTSANPEQLGMELFRVMSADHREDNPTEDLVDVATLKGMEAALSADSEFFDATPKGGA